MKVVLLDFPLVTATSIMVPTAVWVTTVTFGRLLSTVVTVPGTGTWVTIIQVCTGATTLSNSDCPSAAWGINI